MERNSLNLDSIISKVSENTSDEVSGNAFLQEVIYEILKEVGYNFGFSPTPVEKIRKLLGIDLDYHRKLITDAELHGMEERGKICITSEQVNFNQYQEGMFWERGRFSLAHELGHFILIYMFENFPQIDRKYNLRNQKLERLCNFIASELLLPSCVLNTFSLKQVYQRIRPRLKMLSGVISQIDEENSLLHINFLESLRKCFHVSRFVLIRQLHNTRVLNEAECGVIISFFGVNKKTGRSPALRVYFAATPIWGFIPQNIKLSGIGLRTAIDAFNSLKYDELGEWKGQITVYERREQQNRNKWMSNVLIQSRGEHAVYQFAEQQRYLVTTIKWHNPDKGKKNM